MLQLCQVFFKSELCVNFFSPDLPPNLSRLNYLCVLIPRLTLKGGQGTIYSTAFF
jgi:hypothetical protein